MWVLWFVGHCRAADCSSAQRGPLKLRLPKLSLPARQRLTINPLKRKRPKLRFLSFCSLNLKLLKPKPLKLRPLVLAAALVASGASLSAVAGARPTAAPVERGGAWSRLPRWVRFASREWWSPTSFDNRFGFRLVQDLNP